MIFFPQVGCLSKIKGFSLAEVVIALGIAALGFVSLLGLLPQGMEMSRRSADIGAKSRIVQQLSAELNTTPWDKISWASGYGQNRYFNDQGIELSVSDLSKDDVAFTLSYVAAFEISADENKKKVLLPTGAAIAQAQAERQLGDYMRRVNIVVAASADRGFVFGSARPQNIFSFPVVLSKTGTETGY